MDSLACLIFDVDGTLAETEEQHRIAFNDVFAAEGLDWWWDRELYRRLLGVTGGRERMRYWLELSGGDQAAFDDARLKTLHEAKNRRLAERIVAGHCPLRPGVARIVAAARAAGLRLAVATTTSRVNIETLVSTAFGRPADAVFDTLVTGENVRAKKPDPEAYLTVLERLSLRPAQCLVFEDSAIGLAAARAAGLATIVTPSAYTLGEDFMSAQMVVDDLSALTLADLGRVHAAARARA